ncbi:MAG: ABC transporter ATP-binding protein [Lachnospiraceae bacterium]
MKSLLTLQHVSYAYHTATEETPALSDLSFSIPEGSFCSLVGPSGCGKSTLLSILAGLIPADSGQILFQGQPLTGTHPESIGYMLQKDTLFDWLTIEQNILLGPKIQKQNTAAVRAYAEQLLTSYGLDKFRHYHPAELSGGMRQRAALIRTLVLKPPLLLLDEPFSALDYQTRLTVSNDISSIIHKEKKTILLVTHDLSEAISLSDTIFVLSKCPGTLKKTMQISFPKDTTPLQKRSLPEFQTYFQQLWEEL